jgi:pilus assembly protein CpaC
VNEPSDPLRLGTAVDMFFRIPTENISAIVKALHENNFLTLLASPNLSASSGSEASFLAGGEFPIPVVSGAAGMQTVTIAWKEFGVKLKFLPTVLDSNIINIKVASEVSNLDFENGVTLSGFKIPALVSRRSETTVELEQGQYLIIGGLMTSDMAKTVSKIPILGHIPVLGRLFSSRRFLDRESELLITLTPEIIHSMTKEEVPELDLREKRDKEKKK